MSKGINKVILVGHLGQDPEMKALPSGGAVTNISIATSEQWKDKQSGEMRDRTEWHRVVFFNRLAEIVGEYLRKGSQVYVEGRLQTRKWQDQNGQDRYTTEIVAGEMQMLGGRGGGTAPMSGSSYGQQNTASQNQNNNAQFSPPPQQGGNFGSQPAHSPQQGGNFGSQPAHSPQQGGSFGSQPAHSPQQGDSAGNQPSGGVDFDDDIPF